MSRPCASGRGLLARAILVACLTSSVGCAGREGARRSGRSWLPDAEGTTIGRDLGRVPSGSVVTPPSLGVDLVERGRSRDDHSTRVSFEPSRDISR